MAKQENTEQFDLNLPPGSGIGQSENNCKLDSSFEAHWPNFQLKWKGAYKEGKLDGPGEVYWENGKLQSRLTFKDGEKLGQYKIYDENGQLRQVGTYKDSVGTYKDSEEDAESIYINEEAEEIRLEDPRDRTSAVNATPKKRQPALSQAGKKKASDQPWTHPSRVCPDRSFHGWYWVDRYGAWWELRCHNLIWPYAYRADYQAEQVAPFEVDCNR